MQNYILQHDEKKWECDYAATFIQQGIGLLGRKSYPTNRVMVIPKCSSIHTFFMRFPIDVVFLDNAGKVVRVKYNVPPWRVLFGGKGTKITLEAKAATSQVESTFSSIREGDILKLIKA